MAEKDRIKFTEADGHQLAVDLLREVGHEWSTFEDSTSDAWKRQQVQVVARYLATLREHSSPELERGFCAVLTDYLGACVNGGVPDPEYYEREDVE